MSFNPEDFFREQAIENERKRIFSELSFTLESETSDGNLVMHIMQKVCEDKIISPNKRPQHRLDFPVTLHVYPGKFDAYRYDSVRDTIVVEPIELPLNAEFWIRRSEGPQRGVLIEEGDKRLAFVRDARRKAWATDAKSLATFVPRSGRSALAGKSMGRGPDRHVER